MSIAPPTAARNALAAKMNSLYFRRLMPTEAVPFSESRMAPRIRPSRPSRRLRVKARASMTTTSSNQNQARSPFNEMPNSTGRWMKAMPVRKESCWKSSVSTSTPMAIVNRARMRPRRRSAG